MSKKSLLLLALLTLLFGAGLMAQNTGDSITAVQTHKVLLTGRDLELQRDRLLLIDATLELNQTLLQGVQASLDSLNVEDKGTDEKNIQVAIRRMQRQRDKAMLKPEFLHMQDSLEIEIEALKKQKEILVAVLSGNPVPAAKNATAVTQNKPDTVQVSPTQAKVIFEIKPDNQGSTEPAKKNEKQNEKRPVIADTLGIVSQALQNPSTTSASIKQKKKGKKKAEDNLAQNTVKDTMAKAVSRIIPADTVRPVYSRAVSMPIDEALLNLKDNEQQFFDDSINHVRAEYFLTRARKNITDKNYKTAEQNLNKAIAQDHSFKDALIARAGLFMITKQDLKALEDYKLCLKIDSNDPALFYKAGKLELSMKQKDEARSYFEKSLKVDSNYIPSIMEMAGLLGDDGRHNEAIALYNRILVLNVSYHAAYKARGIAKLNKKQYSEAIGDLTRYLIFKEDDAAAYYYRGLAKISRKEKKGACFDLNMAAQLGYHAAKKAIEKNCSK